MTKPLVSVIIPTHNSEATIERCITSLQKQSANRDYYEIIIVDDDSTDHTIEIVKRCKIDNLIQTGPCTVSRARNLGAENANADIIVFLDSDCEADKRWIGTIMVEVRESQAVVGSIENGSTQSRVGWMEYLIEFSAFSEKRKRDQLRWGPTCNIACTKKDFVKSGGFADVNGSEDVLFGESLGHVGVSRYFVPEMKIRHICRTELGKVLSHQEFLGRYSTRVRRENPSLSYSFLGRKRSYIPLVFCSKVAARTFYAIKTRRFWLFVSVLPLIILGVCAFCKGAWKEFGTKK